MTTPDTDPFWDARYADSATFAFGTQPNAYLASVAPPPPADGRALVPGDGEGRNGVWLAGQGWAVTTADGSAAGVAKARRLAADRGVAIDAVRADLLAWDWPADLYDLVASVYLHFAPAHRAGVHARMARALRPGGLLVIEAFAPAQLAHASGGPKDPTMLYTADLLRQDFGPDMDVVDLTECDTVLDEGPLLRGPAAVVRGRFRRRPVRSAT